MYLSDIKSNSKTVQATSNGYKRPALATSDQQCYLYKRYCKRPAVLNRKQCKRPAMATSDQQCYLYKRYCKRPAVLNRKQCKRPVMATSDQQCYLYKRYCKRPAMATSDQHWLQATSNAIYIKDTASDQQC